MTHFKARPTMYKGIQMRSRLEAGFAAWLDNWNSEWKYEPYAFASENGQYLPDFELPNISFIGEPARIFVEVKPTQPDLDLLLVQLSIVKESDPEAQLITVWPDGANFRTMHIFNGSWDELIWTCRPWKFALELPVPTGAGPWQGEYWKPVTPRPNSHREAVETEGQFLGLMMLGRDPIVFALLANEEDGAKIQASLYRPAHELIWRAIVDLYGRGDPVDAITVKDELAKSKNLVRCGGPEYLKALIARAKPELNIGQLACEIAEFAAQRMVRT